MDKLAFFRTHAAAVWYNKLAGRTVADEIKELKAKMSSFEQAKSTIVNSALGKALGMAASTALATAAAKIASIVNRGAWTSSITTYNGKVTVPAGYHNGSGYVQASITNRGAWSSTITTAGGSVTIPAGYHNGSGKVSVSGLYIPPTYDSGAYTVPTGLYEHNITYRHTITFKKAFNKNPTVSATVAGTETNGVATSLPVTISNITKTSFIATVNIGNWNVKVYTINWVAQS